MEGRKNPLLSILQVRSSSPWEHHSRLLCKYIHTRYMNIFRVGFVFQVYFLKCSVFNWKWGQAEVDYGSPPWAVDLESTWCLYFTLLLLGFIFLVTQIL